jgi:hypothetical protein
MTNDSNDLRRSVIESFALMVMALGHWRFGHW